MSAIIDLSKLPAPTVIEPLNYEQIFEARKAALIARYPEPQRVELATTLALESEPLVMLLQESAYRELLGASCTQRRNRASIRRSGHRAIGPDYPLYVYRYVGLASWS